MTQYKKGVRLEREIVQMFKDNGFKAVRTAGSHSEFDVICWKKSKKLKKICFVTFVQCKVTSKDIKLEEFDKLL